MTPTNLALKLKVQASSLSATVLAVVTSIGGLIVGLGVISVGQEGIVIAATTASIGAGALIANAIHTGAIEPSAIETALLAVVTQVVALVVSFALISSATAGTVVAITTAVILCVAQVAHAVLSKSVPA